MTYNVLVGRLALLIQSIISGSLQKLLLKSDLQLNMKITRSK